MSTLDQTLLSIPAVNKANTVLALMELRAWCGH